MSDMSTFCITVINYGMSRDAGLYNATKTFAFASYFCKMRVKILC